MKNTITYLEEMFTTHGPQALGLSCRELAEAINCSHCTASKNLRDLTESGLLICESSATVTHHSGMYSIPEDTQSTQRSRKVAYPRKVRTQKKVANQKKHGTQIDARNQKVVGKQQKVYSQVSSSNRRSTYVYPPSVDCQPSSIPANRLWEVSCHSAFAYQPGGSGLPSKVAETLVALEAGASTAQEVHDKTSISIYTVLKHFKILESAGLVSRHRATTVHVKPLWDTDLLAALDDWAAAMGTDDVPDLRRIKHQAQRESYRTGGKKST